MEIQPKWEQLFCKGFQCIREGFVFLIAMTRIFPIFLILFLVSCSNELPVNMESEGVPVVYCVLDMDDSLQQVRLAKSFLPQEGDFGQDHYTVEQWNEPVEIYLEEWTDAHTPVIYNFSRVNEISQDTGFFADPSFQLYQTYLKPIENMVYYLYLWFPERQYFAYASTIAIGHTEIINPAAIPGRKVTFSETDDYMIELKPRPNAGFHQFNFLLTIEQHSGDDFIQGHFNLGDQVNQEYDGQIMTYLLNSERFYTDLLKQYDTLAGSDYRHITGIEFNVFSYGSELRIYNQLYDNGSQTWEIQSYSSFRNGFGLFSSKAKSRTANLELSDLTYYILTNDPRYKHLKFVQ